MSRKSKRSCVTCDRKRSSFWRNVESGQICQSCYEINMAAELEQDMAEIARLSKKPKNEDAPCTSAQATTSKDVKSPKTSIIMRPRPEPVEKKKRGRKPKIKSTEVVRRKSVVSKKIKKVPIDYKRNAGIKTQIKSWDVLSASAMKGNIVGNISAKTENVAVKVKEERMEENSEEDDVVFKDPLAATHLVLNKATIVSSIKHNGSYLQIGDIVSVIDNQRNTYYAQIRGLIIDMYYTKSAYLTWLIPTTLSPNPNVSFDPSSYLIGPNEEISRKVEYLQFVMHSPNTYFYDKSTQCSQSNGSNRNKDQGPYSWTRLFKAKVEI